MAKRIRVYALVDVHDSFHPLNDVAALFAEEREGGPVLQFAVARRGMTPFFERLADADPDVAEVTEPTRARRGNVFVHDPKHGTLCPDCVPDSLDIGEADIATWPLGFGGWLKPLVCEKCCVSIPVVVDGGVRLLASELRSGDLRAVIDDKEDTIVFTGGKTGNHSLHIPSSDEARIRTHWKGYVESNGG